MTIGRSLLVAGVFLAMAAMPLCSSGKEPAMTMTLQSPAFAHNAAMPGKYTCDGDGISPALRWSGVPSSAKSLALVVDDPDAPDPAAPQRTWVHWVLYDLPPTTDGLAEKAAAKLPAGTREGRNDWQKTGYGAACPPKGQHRYVFKLYALDRVLPDLHAPDKAQLLKAMDGHVLAHAELIGTYQRGR
jgi:Raf kinase inhibitor-like YbhB/YbcL family protein